MTTAPGSDHPPIRAGDEGPAVRDVQQRLAHVLDPALTVDGVFGPATLSAVRTFQRSRGISADGVVGATTWQALVEAGHELGDRLLWQSRTLMRGDDVLELQERLNQLGFDAGTEDGIFGRLTRAAVEEFQRNAGLAVDGVAGDATVRALRRLERSHQSPGVGIRAREREALRRLGGRGLPGSRIMLDPAFGPAAPGPAGPDGSTGTGCTWEIVVRLAGRLSALGVEVSLSRGPNTTPDGSQRARLANDLGVDAVLSLGVNAHPTPIAAGAASYYFGAQRSFSQAGRRLAHLVQGGLVDAGWLPDCRTHPVTWPIVRETRMPTVVTEPGFLTSPRDAARLHDPEWRDRLVGALVTALEGFLADPDPTHPLDSDEPDGNTLLRRG